jgi:hypothetical protein
MTAAAQVRRTQRALGAAAAGEAIAWGTAVTLASIAIVRLIGLAIPYIDHWITLHHQFIYLPGAAAAAFLVWRSRKVLSLPRVALWIEERVPESRYSVVTAIEFASSRFSAEMEDSIDYRQIDTAIRSSLRRRLIHSASALIGSTALLLLSAAATRILLSSDSAAITDGNGAALRNRLEKINVRVVLPPYARGRQQTLDDPASITALAGSRIVVEGSGASTGVSGLLANIERDADSSKQGWYLSVTMPKVPMALVLKDRRYERIIVLDAVRDEPPRIVLRSPTRDSTLRSPALLLQLHAVASDDVGLDAAYFEYLISSGSGEQFTMRTITTVPVRFDRSRSGSVAARLSLSDLELKEGDVVSIRAIAHDANTFSGPGTATSDTRTFRIARAGEYDSLAVDAAAPQPFDSSVISQRMVIMMTERLVKDAKRISRAELVKRSTDIGEIEDGIRKRVYEVLFEGEDLFNQEKAGDPPPDIEDMEPPDDITEAKDPDLRIAFDALWQAVRSLKIGEPAPALPPMRVALKALDRVRLANRWYLRGMPPKVIVDLARVRMTGKEKGSSNPRTPRNAADTARVELERRFNAAIELIQDRPGEAVRALSLLQVQALSVSPQAAAALGEAVDSFRRGRDATIPLLRARRALSGDPRGTPGLPAWSGSL